MTSNLQMLFREVHGAPVPVSPIDGRGTPISANGSTLFDTDQAVVRFHSDRLALAVLFCRVMGLVIGKELTCEMFAAATGGEICDDLKDTL